MSDSADKALAFGQLPGLLAAGLGQAEAVTRLGKSLNPGPTRDALLTAARSIEGGTDPGKALDGVLPEELNDLLSGAAGPTLTKRLRLVGEHLMQRHQLGARLATASRYPLLLVVGLWVIFALVTIVHTVFWPSVNWGIGNLWWYESRIPTTLLSIISLGGLVTMTALCVTTIGSNRRGKVPRWSRMIPGGNCNELSAQAQFMSLLALHLHPSSGVTSPIEAARRAAVVWPSCSKALANLDEDRPLFRTLALTGLSERQTQLVRFGEQANDLAKAASRASSILAKEAGVAGQRLSQWTAGLLLAGAAIGVFMVLLSGGLIDLFNLLG